MLWRPPRRSWCMHRILCTACNRNSTRSFERGHDGNILEEAYRGRYARQRLLNFWPESSCGYHAIKRFVCIIQVKSRMRRPFLIWTARTILTGLFVLVMYGAVQLVHTLLQVPLVTWV